MGPDRGEEAWNRPDLKTYFDEAFAGMPEIKVISDRRIAEVGDAASLMTPDQRTRSDSYDELSHRGFIVVRIW
jgi:hypothetical protein